MLSPFGAAARETGSTSFLIWSTMSSVETDPVFITDNRTPGLPFVREEFCCTDHPSRTCATSRIYTSEPFTVFTVRH